EAMPATAVTRPPRKGPRLRQRSAPERSGGCSAAAGCSAAIASVKATHRAVFIDIDLGLILLCAVCGCSVGGFAPGNITCNAAVHQCRSLTKARCDSSGVAYRGGRPWPFSRPDQNSGVYFNSDTLEEIQIKTAGNDASVGVPGISMVAVIKSGGNDFHGLYSVSDQTPRLQSNNLDDHLRAQGLTAVQPVKTFYDYQADLGGKILQDKLWFYGAYSKQQKNTGITGFVTNAGPDGRYLTGDEPIAYATTGISQWAMKFSYQLTPNNRMNYVWQRGNKFVGEDGAGVLSPLEHTRDYSNPTAINRVEYQSTINSWSLFNVVGGYAGWWSDYSSYRQAEKYGFPLGPSRLDRESGLTTGPNAQNTALRPQDQYML